jgi:Tol biopolymer transport system component
MGASSHVDPARATRTPGAFETRGYHVSRRTRYRETVRFVAAIGMMLGALGCRQILGIESGSVRGDASSAGDAPLDDAPLDDAPSNTDAMIDAAVAWTNLQVVAGLAPGDEDPSLTGDMLELYFTRGNDVMFVTRPNVGAAWSTPMTVMFPMGANMDVSPEVTTEGLFLLFASDRGAGSGLDLYYVARAMRSSPWSMPAAMTELNASPSNERPGATTTDGRRLVMSSDRNSTTGLDLFEAIRPGILGTPYDPPVRIPLSTNGEDGSPFLSPDGLTLYYAMAAAGSPQRDLYVSTRATLADQFTVGTPIDELNTAVNDSDPWVSPDGREIYFLSSRDGSSRIWRATR